jgi:hypothetical protein
MPPFGLAGSDARNHERRDTGDLESALHKMWPVPVLAILSIGAVDLVVMVPPYLEYADDAEFHQRLGSRIKRASP